MDTPAATIASAPSADAETPPNPGAILQLGTAFWASKTLLSAVELDLFTNLAGGPLTGEELRARLGIHPRGARDFFDALVALGMLDRDGDRYANTRDGALFLDRHRPTYVGGMLAMANSRLYTAWGSLTEALRTGRPHNELDGGAMSFEELYADPARRESFLSAMTGVSLGASRAIARIFPWRGYRSFADLGTAQGGLPVQLALAHPHLEGIGYDLPIVRETFEEYVRQNGVADRVRFIGGDLFADPLPPAEVMVLGHVLHGFDLETKKNLLRKVHAALPAGGAVIVHEALIDDERRHNAFGLLMSLNMLIETEAGFDYTGADALAWLREVGFRDARVEHLAGPDSMAVGIK